jgi:hypothetical protein
VAGGGQLACLSGNTMFWRVSFDADVMECRKLSPSVGQQNVFYGEVFHEQDGHFRGGLMREADCPAWQVIGLECAGLNLLGAYTVTCPSHEFFQCPESAGVVQDSILGGPNSVGNEWDVTVTRISGDRPPLPDDYTPPRVLAHCQTDATQFDYATNLVFVPNGVISEVIDWQPTGGGRVFAVGSIGASAALRADRSLAVTLRNALHHMGIVFRLNVSAIGAGGHFVNKSFDGTSWDASFLDMGMPFASPPTGVMWAPGKLAVAAISTSGTLYYNYFDGGTWSGFSSFGDGFTGSPAAVAWGRNQLTLFARHGTNLHQRVWDGATWSPWQDLGDGVTSDPTAVSWGGDHLSVAVLGPDKQILYKHYAGGAWSPSQTTWQDLGGSFDQAPTLHTWNDHSLSIVAVGSHQCVFYQTWDGQQESPSSTWVDLGVGPVDSRIAIASFLHVGGSRGGAG